MRLFLMGIFLFLFIVISILILGVLDILLQGVWQKWHGWGSTRKQV